MFKQELATDVIVMNSVITNLDHYFVYTKQNGTLGCYASNFQLVTNYKVCSDFEVFRLSVDFTMYFTKTSYHCTHND